MDRLSQADIQSDIYMQADIYKDRHTYRYKGRHIWRKEEGKTKKES